MKPALKSLILWYKNHARELPWRQTRNPYEIWISEIVLQQTRVEQGKGYYLSLLEQFTNVEALAQASEEQLLKCWEGLGYYSRARNLHAAAKQLVDWGDFPDTIEGLLQLKGVGPYTARAIACFAFDRQVGVVDGNIFRVLSRLDANKLPINQPKNRQHYQQRADELAVLSGDAYHYNQAMMELGASLCSPTKPKCSECPLAMECKAKREGTQERFPVKLKGQAKKTRYFQFQLARNGGELGLIRKKDSFWKGLYVLPYRELNTPIGEPILKHVFTHFTMWVYVADELPANKEALTVARTEVANYPLPKAMHRLLEWAGNH